MNLLCGEFTGHRWIPRTTSVVVAMNKHNDSLMFVIVNIYANDFNYCE